MNGGSPLAGKTIIVTRPEKRAGPLSEALRARGARVVEAPAIRILPPLDLRPLDEALSRISSFDFVVFTSANAVDAVVDRYAELGSGARLPRLRFAAVGAATAESLRERGYAVDVTPERFTAEAVFDSLRARGEVSGRSFLLPRADIAKETLPELLRSHGARVSAVVAYRTVPATEALASAVELVRAEEVDFVTFTSASTVRSFFECLGDRTGIEPFGAVSIGPITSSALRQLGVEPEIEAEISTTQGLVDAIVRHVKKS